MPIFTVYILNICTILLLFCSLLKLEWKQIFTFDTSPNTKSETEITDFPNTVASKIPVFCVSDLVFGVRSKVNI